MGSNERAKIVMTDEEIANIRRHLDGLIVQVVERKASDPAAYTLQDEPMLAIRSLLERRPSTLEATGQDAATASNKAVDSLRRVAMSRGDGSTCSSSPTRAASAAATSGSMLSATSTP